MKLGSIAMTVITTNITIIIVIIMSAVATTALTPNIKDQQATVLLHILRS
jgi:hypothetical protein